MSDTMMGLSVFAGMGLFFGLVIYGFGPWLWLALVVWLVASGLN